MDKMIKLRDVLINAEEYPWRDSVFLPENKNWNLDSECAVLNLDDLEIDEDVPPFAIDNHLIYSLGIQDVQDIIINAREQHTNCTDEDFLKAFLYYYDNDAFIDFNK
jgi:hypothetical protein